MSLPLSGRSAVITGAANGIGRALALRAAEEGMSLALADIDANGLAAVAEEVRTMKAPVLAEALDVREPLALRRFARAVFDRLGSVALVFANAGVMRAATSWLQPVEEWDLVLDVNLKGSVHTANAFMPGLLAQTERSRIVFSGSTSAFLPRPHLVSYSCSKHALWGVAEAMQLELLESDAPVGISFLAPAGVKTGIASATGQPAQDGIRRLLDAFGTPPDQIAEIAFDMIKAEHFWILPHPEFKSALEARLTSLIAERNPGRH